MHILSEVWLQVFCCHLLKRPRFVTQGDQDSTPTWLLSRYIFYTSSIKIALKTWLLVLTIVSLLLARGDPCANLIILLPRYILSKFHYDLVKHSVASVNKVCLKLSFWPKFWLVMTKPRTWPSFREDLCARIFLID